MLRNYLQSAFRHLWKHKTFSFLNIAGLTIGMSACFLVFLYVRFELSYDAFHSKKDRIYRMVCDIKTPTEVIHADVCSNPMAVNAKLEFPEVDQFCRFSLGSTLFRKGEIKFQEDKTGFTDSTFFRMFDFPLLQGDPSTALREPFSVVMSESAAKKYFGKENPMGQHLLWTDGNQVTTVTGIMKDIPENSLLKADVLVSQPLSLISIVPTTRIGAASACTAICS